MEEKTQRLAVVRGRSEFLSEFPLPPTESNPGGDSDCIMSQAGSEFNPQISEQQQGGIHY